MIEGKKPKKAKDWASTLAVMFGLGLFGVVAANYLVADFPLTIKTFLFLVIAIVVLFIALKFLRFASPIEQFRFEDVILYGLVLAGLVFAVIKFNIAPEFTIVARNLASIVGLG